MDDLDDLASSAGFVLIDARNDDVVVYSDMDTTYAIAQRDDEFVVEWASHRAQRFTRITTSDLASARNYLAATFAALLRSRADAAPLRAERTAPGTTVDAEGSSALLTWPDGWARYSADRFAEREATTFSHAVAASVGKIRQSYADPEGRPLFG